MASCRKCSHCGGTGHNSRTCAERVGVRLFGVRISGDAGGSTAAIRKSASTGSLAEPSAFGCDGRQAAYASDDPTHTSSKYRERKKGVPWTEEEHRLFLMALQKLGKGDWRGISKNYVKTRTPTQVASHAQKYFLRQSNVSKRRRRSSLFDLASDGAPAGDASGEGLHHPSPLHSARHVRMDSSLLVNMVLSDESKSPCAGWKGVTDEVRAPLPSKSGVPAYRQQFPGSKEAQESVDTTFFSHYYHTWLQLHGYPHLGRNPSSEEPKLVKPIPTSLTKTVHTDLPPSELTSMKAAQPVIEHTFLSLELSEESRHSAFHTLEGSAVKGQGSSCGVMSVA